MTEKTRTLDLTQMWTETLDFIEVESRMVVSKGQGENGWGWMLNPDPCLLFSVRQETRSSGELLHSRKISYDNNELYISKSDEMTLVVFTIKKL